MEKRHLIRVLSGNYGFVRDPVQQPTPTASGMEAINLSTVELEGLQAVVAEGTHASTFAIPTVRTHVFHLSTIEVFLQADDETSNKLEATVGFEFLSLRS